MLSAALPHLSHHRSGCPDRRASRAIRRIGAVPVLEPHSVQAGADTGCVPVAQRIAAGTIRDAILIGANGIAAPAARSGNGS